MENESVAWSSDEKVAPKGKRYILIMTLTCQVINYDEPAFYAFSSSKHFLHTKTGQGCM
jgi:hypothetical protein